MTFDEWYKKNYEGGWSLAILAKSPPAIERYEIAKAAWNAGKQEGVSGQVRWQEYLDSMED
jgi:hypothetical protein